MIHNSSASYENISGTQLICPNPCALGGIFVGIITGAGSITVYDQASSIASGAAVSAFSVAQSTWYPLPFQMQQGLYVVVTGVTLTATVGFS